MKGEALFATQRSLRVEHLYLSKDHNFFGHHGQTAANHAEIEVEAVECVAGSGIRGDRFFDYKKDYKGQITFFSMEVFEWVCTHLHLTDKVPSAMRRNVLVRGVDLNGLIGHRFTLQGVSFSAVEECRPCYWMDQALAPGAEELLKGYGGLRARILTDGWLEAGKMTEWEALEIDS